MICPFSFRTVNSKYSFFPAGEVKTFLKTNSHNHIPEEEAVAPPNELFLKKPTLSDFVIHGTIGKGSFGEVYLVQKKSNQQYFAMKSLSKKQILKENLTRYALTERNVLSAISHPFIVKLRFAFQNSVSSRSVST